MSDGGDIRNVHLRPSNDRQAQTGRQDASSGYLRTYFIETADIREYGTMLGSTTMVTETHLCRSLRFGLGFCHEARKFLLSGICASAFKTSGTGKDRGPWVHHASLSVCTHCSKLQVAYPEIMKASCIGTSVTCV